ncbi:MAG TPA: alpha/beta fold hydrolase [Steroidobacteraceae bacterium]
MSEPLPIVLIPGLLLSPPLYAAQLPALWRRGPVTIAAHYCDDSMAAIAQRILAGAPPRFALVGLSMGGYISFEIMRQAPQRVARLALLDTMALPDTPEVSSARRTQMALAEAGRLDQVVDNLWPRLVHPGRQGDRALRALIDAMAADVGSQGYLHQQRANISRPDSRPTLAGIRCPTLVLVGDQDALTPPERAVEIASGIAGARLVRVADCGHLSTLERPDEVTQALHGWLSA